MRHNLYLLLILFGLLPGISFAGDPIFLARLEIPSVPTTRSPGIDSIDYDWRIMGDFHPVSDRIRGEFSGSEITDEVLGSIQGKAIETTLPSFETEKSGIILWDEAKIKSVDRLNLGNGRNLSIHKGR